MGDVVNLNRFRKGQARRDKETRAAENRTRFGRTKEDRAKTEAETAKLAKDLDDKRIE